jgi:hypothetical protein
MLPCCKRSRECLPVRNPEPDARIEGIITQIAEDPRTFDGSATVEAVVEGRLRRVHVRGFDASTRELLISAFRNRQRLQVEGELTSEGPRLKWIS